MSNLMLIFIFFANPNLKEGVQEEDLFKTIRTVKGSEITEVKIYCNDSEIIGVNDSGEWIPADQFSGYKDSLYPSRKMSSLHRQKQIQLLFEETEAMHLSPEENLASLQKGLKSLDKKVKPKKLPFSEFLKVYRETLPMKLRFYQLVVSPDFDKGMLREIYHPEDGLKLLYDTDYLSWPITKLYLDLF